MSPVVITILIVAGITILIAIAFINSTLEKNKLEKARQKADLTDRVRRCGNLSESMPGQMMSPALKLLLSKIELQLGEQLLPLDKGNAPLLGRLGDLRTQVAMGESIPIKNPPQPVLAEAKAKEIRFQLEALHSLIVRAQQDGQLNAADAKNWSGEIRTMLVLIHIELFSNLGLQALQQSQPRQARLAFERGVQYLQKQADVSRYQAQLQKLQQQLAHANALVLETSQPNPDDNSQLNEGLKSLADEDDGWKKKSF